MSTYHQIPEDNIYSSAIVQALEQTYCSSCSAAVVSSCLVSSQRFGARVVSRIYNGGRQAVYTAAVAAMMVQNLTPGAYAATSTITPGQTVSNLVIPDGDITDLNVSGSTVDTTVNATGKEMIKSGGVASGTTVNSGGSQVVSRGGSAISTVINDGGSQIVISSGLASNTQVSAGGVHAVNAGGSSLDFIQQSGGVLRLNIASKTFVSGQDASGQTLIASGGSALGWQLHDTPQQYGHYETRPYIPQIYQNHRILHQVRVVLRLRMHLLL